MFVALTFRQPQHPEIDPGGRAGGDRGGSARPDVPPAVARAPDGRPSLAWRSARSSRRTERQAEAEHEGPVSPFVKLLAHFSHTLCALHRRCGAVFRRDRDGHWRPPSLPAFTPGTRYSSAKVLPSRSATATWHRGHASRSEACGRRRARECRSSKAFTTRSKRGHGGWVGRRSRSAAQARNWRSHSATGWGLPHFNAVDLLAICDRELRVWRTRRSAQPAHGRSRARVC